MAFLPVYDNLERALKQDTADEAYKKGVEMTMNQLKSVLEKLGITEIDGPRESPLTPPSQRGDARGGRQLGRGTPWPRSFRPASSWGTR